MAPTILIFGATRPKSSLSKGLSRQKLDLKKETNKIVHMLLSLRLLLIHVIDATMLQFTSASTHPVPISKFMSQDFMLYFLLN